MAKFAPRRRGLLENPEEVLTLAQRLLEQAKRQWKWLVAGVVLVAVVVSAFSITAAMRAHREERAEAALLQVRAKLPKDGATTEGVKALDQFTKEYGGSLAAWQAELQRANMLYDLKQFADAARAYEALEGRDPGLDLLLKDSLSYCYESMGDLKKAAQVLKPLAEQSPEMFKGEILRRLATLYDRAQEPQEAVVYWRKLLENPTDPAIKPYLEEKLAAAEAKIKK